MSEDLESEEKIPIKAKQTLMIKKISNMLIAKPGSIAKSGVLTKQGDKANKKIEERFLVLLEKEIRWYHNEDEFKKKQ